MAEPKEEQAVEKREGSSHRSPSPLPRPPPEKADTKCLYVGNLPYDCDSKRLENLLSEAGSVVKIFIAVDKRTGHSKGHAFVEFANHEDCAKAFKRFNGYTMEDRKLRLDWDLELGKKEKFSVSSENRRYNPYRGGGGYRGRPRHDRGYDRGYGGYDRGHDRGYSRGYDRGYDDYDRGRDYRDDYYRDDYYRRSRSRSRSYSPYKSRSPKRYDSRSRSRSR